MLKLLLFVLPLGLDTFAVAASLGVAGLPKSARLKASLIMSGFELAMPVLGLLLGVGLGQAIGGVADYVAAGALVLLGGYLLVADDESDGEKVAALGRLGGIALLGLGLSISLDELAMGVTIGLLDVP